MERDGVETDCKSANFVNSLLGLKYGILVAGTSMRAPVLGLQPIRERRCRVPKVPDPRISTPSPERSERTMPSSMLITTVSDSFFDNPCTRESSSLKCARVMSRRLVPSGKIST